MPTETMMPANEVPAQELINLDECTTFRVPVLVLATTPVQPGLLPEDQHDLELLAGVDR
jgi:hypothetical protein